MKRIILVTSILLFSLSCSKEEKGLEVSVTGFVRLVTETGEQVSKNGIRVNIPENHDWTETDEKGKYLFTSLKAATNYSFEFTEPGYGYKCTAQKSFIGNQKPGFIDPVLLYQQPSVMLENAVVRRQNGSVELTASVRASNHLGLMVFFNDSNSISEKDFDYSNTYIYNSSGMTSINLAFSTMHMSYTAGTEIYLAIYLFNAFEEQYYNPVEKTSGRTSLKKAAILKFTF